MSDAEIVRILDDLMAAGGEAATMAYGGYYYRLTQLVSTRCAYSGGEEKHDAVTEFANIVTMILFALPQRGEWVAVNAATGRDVMSAHGKEADARVYELMLRLPALELYVDDLADANRTCARFRFADGIGVFSATPVTTRAVVRMGTERDNRQ